MMRRCTSTAILVLFCLFSSLKASPAATATSWRTISREARIALYEKRYNDAIGGYQNAISALPSGNQFYDIRLDLMLEIAETYRICGQLPQCEYILGQVEKDLEKGIALDSTLGARFWRRKSDLHWNRNQIRESCKAYEQVVIALKKDFPAESRHFMSASGGLVKKLTADKHFDIFIQYMHNFLEHIPENSRTTETLEQIYGKDLVQVRLAIEEQITNGDLATAKRLLMGLRDVNRKRVKLGYLWSVWLHHCIDRKETRLLKGVDAELLELIGYYGKERRLHQKVLCHLALERLYFEKYQPEKQDKQMAELSATITQLGNEATSKERVALVESYSRPAAEEVIRDPCSAKARHLLENIVQITPMPPTRIAQDDRDYYCVQHGSSRTRLMRLLIRLGEIEEAERILATLDESAFHVWKVGYLRRARKHVDFAMAYISRKQLDKAEEHLKRAEIDSRADIEHWRKFPGFKGRKFSFDSAREEAERADVARGMKLAWETLRAAKGLP